MRDRMNLFPLGGRFVFVQCMLAAWLCVPGDGLNAQPSRRPNILIFLTDDQGWGELSINVNKNLVEE